MTRLVGEWSDLGCILEAESAGLTDRSALRCEKENRVTPAFVAKATVCMVVSSTFW